MKRFYGCSALPCPRNPYPVLVCYALPCVLSLLLAPGTAPLRLPCRHPLRGWRLVVSASWRRPCAVPLRGCGGTTHPPLPLAVGSGCALPSPAPCGRALRASGRAVAAYRRRFLSAGARPRSSGQPCAGLVAVATSASATQPRPLARGRAHAWSRENQKFLIFLEPFFSSATVFQKNKKFLISERPQHPKVTLVRGRKLVLNRPKRPCVNVGLRPPCVSSRVGDVTPTLGVTVWGKRLMVNEGATPRHLYQRNQEKQQRPIGTLLLFFFFLGFTAVSGSPAPGHRY